MAFLTTGRWAAARLRWPTLSRYYLNRALLAAPRPRAITQKADPIAGRTDTVCALVRRYQHCMPASLGSITVTSTKAQRSTTAMLRPRYHATTLWPARIVRSRIIVLGVQQLGPCLPLRRLQAFTTRAGTTLAACLPPPTRLVHPVVYQARRSTLRLRSTWARCNLRFRFKRRRSVDYLCHIQFNIPPPHIRRHCLASQTCGLWARSARLVLQSTAYIAATPCNGRWTRQPAARARPHIPRFPPCKRPSSPASRC